MDVFFEAYVKFDAIRSVIKDLNLKYDGLIIKVKIVDRREIEISGGTRRPAWRNILPIAKKRVEVMELKPVSWGDGGEFVEFEKPIPIHGYNRSRNLDAEFDGVEGFEAAFIPKAELDAIMEYPGSEQLRLTKMSIKIPSEIGRGAIKKYVTYLATPMPHNGFDGPFRSPFGVSTKDGVQYSVAPTCPPIWRIPMSNDMKNVVEILTAQQEIKYISGLSYKLPWQTKVAGFISQPINWLVGNTLNLITLNFRGLRGL